MSLRWPKCDCVPHCQCLGNARVRAEHEHGQADHLRKALAETWGELRRSQAKLETLDSERAANAMLTAEVERLTTENEGQKASIERLRFTIGLMRLPEDIHFDI